MSSPTRSIAARAFSRSSEELLPPVESEELDDGELGPLSESLLAESEPAEPESSSSSAPAVPPSADEPAPDSLDEPPPSSPSPGVSASGVDPLSAVRLESSPSEPCWLLEL